MSINYKIVDHVAMPILKKETDIPIFVLFVEEIIEGEVIKNSVKGASEDGKDMEPARLAHVVNLESGEHMSLICNTVIEARLDERYPDKDYVGRQFRIVQQQKREGKRYFDYVIQEIEVDNSDAIGVE